MRLAIRVIYLWMLPIILVHGHLPEYMSTPADKIDQFCILAEKCFHDTVPVCGRSGDELRSFLDTCDMLEYACDSNQAFTHIEDTKTCPVYHKIPSFIQ